MHWTILNLCDGNTAKVRVIYNDDYDYDYDDDNDGDDYDNDDGDDDDDDDDVINRT